MGRAVDFRRQNADTQDMEPHNKSNRHKFSLAALENIEETGCDPIEDVAAIRSGAHTRESLLAFCLKGADEDRVHGWRDYVDTICDRASDVTTT